MYPGNAWFLPRTFRVVEKNDASRYFVLTHYDAVRYCCVIKTKGSQSMSNLAEKLPRFLRDALEDAETRGRKLVDQVDSWVEETLPESVVAPLREAEGLKLDALRTAAEAAGDEIVTLVKGKLQVLRGGKSDNDRRGTSSREACGKEACGKEACGKEACGKEACGKEACGKKPRRRSLRRRSLRQRSLRQRSRGKEACSQKPAQKRQQSLQPRSSQPRRRPAQRQQSLREEEHSKEVVLTDQFPCDGVRSTRRLRPVSMRMTIATQHSLKNVNRRANSSS